MKYRILSLIFTAALAASCAAAQPEPKSEVLTELKALINKTAEKIHEGKRTPADLAPELKEFDALLARHRGEKTDDVAQVLLMKARLYFEVFEDTPKGIELVQQLKRDFPNSRQAKNADVIIDSVKREQEAKKIQKSLVAGAAFPAFSEKDLNGKPLSPAGYKGKVVLVDFWATWCGPCVGELPNVLKTYQKYHGKGFEIIGVSLDQDEQKLRRFLQEKGMTWQQYFDGKGWENKLAMQYGVQSIPTTFLLGKDGKILDRDLRGADLDTAVAKAVGAK